MANNGNQDLKTADTKTMYEPEANPLRRRKRNQVFAVFRRDLHDCAPGKRRTFLRQRKAYILELSISMRNRASRQGLYMRHK